MPHDGLFTGNELFRKSYCRAHEKEFLELAKKGQNPKALYIGCSDSRVIPDMMTNSAPGDLFVVRNVGNFVAPYSPDDDFHSTASAIEYAVSILEVKHIIVCGHTQCGAIEAIHDKSELYSEELVHTRKWLTLGEQPKKQAILALGRDADKEALLRLTEKLSVISQIENLLTYPSVKKRVDDNEIQLHGWIYNIGTGEVDYYNPETSHFEPLNLLKIEE